MKNNSTPYTLNSTMEKPILLISASDSSAAAGMQVDLRVLSDLGAAARCAVTAVTVQGDGGARSINPVKPEIISEAINTAIADAPGVGAVKVGLLCEKAAALALRDPLSALESEGIPVVVDPVMRSTPGSELSTGDTAAAILENVLPRATLLTPNRGELDVMSTLMGTRDGEEAVKVARLLETGVGGVLVTGGDTTEDHCTDILYTAVGKAKVFKHPRIGNRAPRGTGCALSTAIAFYLGKGLPMDKAVARSIQYVTTLIEKAAMVGEQLLLFPGKGRNL